MLRLTAIRLFRPIAAHRFTIASLIAFRCAFVMVFSPSVKISINSD
jgi:hypothetical protein